jgi:tetratricopeptide (TPR) repeat protein/TolB-like protein
VALTIGVATTATAQQLAAPQQPTERLLILPFMASSADSATSIALADAVRDRVNALVKSKILVVPKAKLCEALSQSGFPCNGLLDDQQAKQLARFLQVHAYVTGTFVKSGSNLTADVQMIDIGSSGIAGRFTATNGNPGTAVALAETIAQKIATTVRVSEQVRACYDDRRKGQFARARGDAQKALALDPNSTAAWLCIATIYEAQRYPVDSMIAANERALKGDSLNGTALQNLAQLYQQKGDTAKAMDALIKQVRGEPRNTQRRLQVAQLLRQSKQYEGAIRLINEGLDLQSGDAQLLEMKLTICTEASNFRCALDVWLARFERDSAARIDTTFLKPALGAAQQVSDTQALLKFTEAAVRSHPNNVSFVKARAGAFELAGKTDSALVYYKKALAVNTNDVGTSLQIAKTLIDRATYDTSEARKRREAKDTVGLRRMQEAFAQRLDSALPFLRPGLASPDSTQRLAGAVIMLTAGSKLAQANAYPAAYTWLDSLLNIIGPTPKTLADTLGPKQQVRINASFWYGLSSILTLQPEYKKMTDAKGAARCPAARAVFDRLERTKAALQLGRRVHPPTADQMLGFVGQYEKAKPSVQAAYKCKPTL